MIDFLKSVTLRLGLDLSFHLFTVMVTFYGIINTAESRLRLVQRIGGGWVCECIAKSMTAMKLKAMMK